MVGWVMSPLTLEVGHEEEGEGKRKEGRTMGKVTRSGAVKIILEKERKNILTLSQK